MNNEGKSFLKNFFILGVGSFIYLIVGIIGTPIITRLVDPVEYGYMSMFTVYSQIGMMVLGLGLDQALIRYFYRKEDIDYKKRLLLECYLIPGIVSVVIGIVVFLGCIITNSLKITNQSLFELLLLEINILILLINRYALLVLRLRYKTKDYSVVSVLQKTLYILFTLLGVAIFHNYYFEILAISTILSTLISTVWAIFRDKELWVFSGCTRAPLIPIKELLNYGIPIMFATGISMIFNALDKIFLNHFCTLSDVGVYTSAMNLMAVFSIVRTSFNALWMPSAVEHYEKNKNDKTFYQRGNSFIVLLMVTIGAAVILCKDIFVLLLGSKYQAAAEIIPFLMFEPIMYTISETTTTGMIIEKKSKYQIMVASGSFVVNFMGNLLLTPLMGPKGAALSTGVSYIVFFILRTILSNRVFYVDYKLKRFSIIIVLLFAYAWYGSSHYISIFQVGMFIGIMVIMCLLYRNNLSDALGYIKEILKKITRKKV